MRSECGPAPSGDPPGGILDLWESVAVDELTDEHTVCILGVELRVRACRPAARGGDFYVLEAARCESLASDGDAVGMVLIEVDRNRLVPARRADGGADR
ncbi:hypothetical protein ACFQY7_16655 [Actinomadura luteofluorescens]|uniref:Uncharacterized protein n=1 Tax=Actinomadura luteofluorescens TaxID=46163 RepID=A0A7Y9JKK9_9ACTN|nr:hypothetical protein [Actinomadura luteofluorescens]NYD51951.1 hypothetical protein [Actinomadura luteofluorescens]